MTLSKATKKIEKLMPQLKKYNLRSTDQKSIDGANNPSVVLDSNTVKELVNHIRDNMIKASNDIEKYLKYNLNQ